MIKNIVKFKNLVDDNKNIMINQIAWIIFSIPSFLIASTVHEFAHAYTAYKLGDLTAKINGRMTLNPLAHIDPVGALMMIFARFGWSKPVPVNEYNFKNPVIGTALTALAGPVSNFILAVFGAIPLRFLMHSKELNSDTLSVNFLTTTFITFILVNLSLGIFNLIPLPPLDGHKIVRAFLPEQLRYYWDGLNKYGIWILVFMFLPFSPLSYVINLVLETTIFGLLNFLLL